MFDHIKKIKSPEEFEAHLKKMPPREKIVFLVGGVVSFFKQFNINFGDQVFCIAFFINALQKQYPLLSNEDIVKEMQYQLKRMQELEESNGN